MKQEPIIKPNILKQVQDDMRSYLLHEAIDFSCEGVVLLN